MATATLTRGMVRCRKTPTWPCGWSVPHGTIRKFTRLPSGLIRHPCALRYPTNKKNYAMPAPTDRVAGDSLQGDLKL